MTGEELKALRIKLGLTQTKMGEHLGLTASAISYIESGDNPITKQTELLASKLAESGNGQ